MLSSFVCMIISSFFHHHEYQHSTCIFSSDPYFVPEISVKGVTFNSITIGWSQPPEEMRDHVHYYMLIVQNNRTTMEAVHPEQYMNLFLFTDLESATTYRFKVSLVYEVQYIMNSLIYISTRNIYCSI